MSRLTDLIAQAKKQDPRLGAALEQEFHSRTQRTFGLVFERHLPEEVELPGRPVRRGDNVHVLPPRGSNDKPDPRTWRVISTHKDDNKTRLAQLVEADPTAGTQPELRDNTPVSDLVVVAQQDDVIYPGLVQTGEVIGSDDKDTPFHSVINAENYHALKMLTYTHYHSIDCIYIDPPYNTGAKDWKYNNDYVDGEDGYRHSKWLSFMERRLLVAKQLLNPDDSVLIVTIDEKEYLRLGLLLEQTFPEAVIQMATIVIRGQGSARGQAMSRVEEYAYFVYMGSARAVETKIETLSSDDGQSQSGNERIWFPLIRGGASGVRAKSYASFYPIFVDPQDGKIVGRGAPLPPELHPEDFNDTPDGVEAVWPISKEGIQGRWQMGTEEFDSRWESGFIRGGKKRAGRWPITYIREGTISRIATGEIISEGKDEFGALILRNSDEGRSRTPKTVWYVKSHNAGSFGTDLVSKFLPGRRFPFPKSLYAVEDALRFFVKDKPDATVLDFFSGSGTTAHAVMRLNKQDGGRRRSISVTNNEVSADEQIKLRKQGLRPGDPEWEQWGICDYVTNPRVQAAITGRTPAGAPIKGDYKFTDEFPMSDGFNANARFFTLTYEPPTRVRHGYAFTEIAPMLWLRAGQTGRIISEIPERGWDVAESYGVIENVAASKQFLDAVNQQDSVKVIYIVTNDDLVFESMAREMANTDAELVRLYATYLNNFSFQQARENNN